MHFLKKMYIILYSMNPSASLLLFDLIKILSHRYFCKCHKVPKIFNRLHYHSGSHIVKFFNFNSIMEIYMKLYIFIFQYNFFFLFNLFSGLELLESTFHFLMNILAIFIGQEQQLFKDTDVDNCTDVIDTKSLILGTGEFLQLV